MTLFVAGVGFLLVKLYQAAAANKTALIAVTALVVPIMLFVALYQFVGIYVQVPEAMGGGRPVHAELIFSKDEAIFWSQTGLAAPNLKPTMSGELKIVYRNDHDVVLMAPYKEGQNTREKVVVVSRSLIDGVLLKDEDCGCL